VFARKLIRPSGDVTKSDILSEIQAIETISKMGGSPFLINILAHGWLPHSSDYYMDMELCGYNLDAWIANNKPLYFPNVEYKKNSNIYQYRLRNYELESLLTEILNVMLQIANGLYFIHCCKLVHRDLNPRNGISTDFGNKSHSP